MKEIKTGIYIRVSTDEQVKHGFSIRAQKEKLYNYSKIKEWDIYDFYIDEGISGKNLERPEIQRLINDIKTKRVNNVLVFKIDRLTRATKDLIDLVELFQKNDCDFNSLTESIDTSSPTGRMFIKIIGLFAEFERETIAERIKVGLERKVKEGYSISSSTISYGYRKNKGDKVQKIDEKEAKVVKQIFKMFLNNKSILEIKEYLIKQNIKTKKSKNWSSKTITNILKNPNYVGKVRYGLNTNRYFEKKGKHQSIITQEQYTKTAHILSNRLRTKDDAYYSNKLICMCNKCLSTKRTYINKKCYINYICKNKECNFKSISHKYLDNYYFTKEKSQDTKKNIIQKNIKKIHILSPKKDKITLYNSVNKLNKNFTFEMK